MSINIGYEVNEADEVEAKKFLSEHREKQIRHEILEIIDDEFYRLEEYAADHIANAAKNRAEEFLSRVISGNGDAAAAIFEIGRNGRYRDAGYDTGKPWSKLIYGEIFQTSQMELRDKLVNDYADLLRTEHIADLESIIDGLKRQIIDLEKQIYAQF